MSTSKFKVAFALALMVSMAAGHAGGGGSVMGNGGATEITQVLNNGQLIEQVRQQVNTVNQLMQTYRVSYSQLQQQILSGTNLGGVTLGDVTRVKSDYDRYQGSLRTVGLDLNSLERMFDQRRVDARLQNMTMDQYLERERQRIAQEDAKAKARLAREQALLQQTNDDILIAKQYGDQVGQTIGEHEAIALLNRQMNQLLQQNTRMLTLMANAESEKADRESVQNNERLSVDDLGKQVLTNQSDMRNRQKQALEYLRSKR